MNLTTIMGKHAQNPFEPWDDRAVEAIAKDFGELLLDWVKKEGYEAGSDVDKDGEWVIFWMGEGDDDLPLPSAELIERFLNE